MIVEGVNFVESAVKQMKKKDFIDTHKKVFWLDRKPEEREKMLSDTYDAITKPKGGGKPNGDEE